MYISWEEIHTENGWFRNSDTEYHVTQKFWLRANYTRAYDYWAYTQKNFIKADEKYEQI